MMQSMDTRSFDNLVTYDRIPLEDLESMSGEKTPTAARVLQKSMSFQLDLKRSFDRFKKRRLIILLSSVVALLVVFGTVISVVIAVFQQHQKTVPILPFRNFNPFL